MFSLRDVWEKQGPGTACFILFSATCTPVPKPTAVPRTAPHFPHLSPPYFFGTRWLCGKPLGSILSLPGEASRVMQSL